MARSRWSWWLLSSASCQDPRLVVEDLLSDNCEELCASVGQDLAGCFSDWDSLTWEDLGAQNRSGFVTSCQDQWAETRVDLTASELRLSLAECKDASEALQGFGCDELLALYGPAE